MARSIGEGLNWVKRRDRAQVKRSPRLVPASGKTLIIKGISGFGRHSLEAYIKQQRAARRHRIKVTLAKRWEP